MSKKGGYKAWKLNKSASSRSAVVERRMGILIAAMTVSKPLPKPFPEIFASAAMRVAKNLFTTYRQTKSILPIPFRPRQAG
jgi:hypothetical protein